MKFSRKLPLAFTLALAGVIAAALFGMFRLHQSLGIYETDVKKAYLEKALVFSMLVDFKTQVQEWKNTLLRGADEGQRERYWTAFQKLEKSVAQSGERLLQELPAGQARDKVEQFLLEHRRMGERYRKAFAEFAAANFDHRVGDKAVQGMDRAPAKLLDESVALISESADTRASQADASSRQATAVSLLVLAVVFTLSMAASLWFSRSVVRQLGGEPDAVRDIANAIAKGDLSASVQVHGADKDSVMAAIAVMRDSLRQLVHRVQEASEHLGSASEQVAQGNQDLSERTEQQASTLEQTAASMQDVVSHLRDVSQLASQAHELSRGAFSAANLGDERVAAVVASMEGINQAAGKIADITNVIDSLAFQTNILALNAAVEAARAGEAGRGFAVVAGEVRSLAQRSAMAAREIKDLIQSSVERVQAGKEQVDNAREAMQKILHEVDRCTQVIGEISSAQQRQTESIEQIGAAVSLLDQNTQQNAALVEEIAAAADGLQKQGQQLVDMVHTFRV